MTTEKQIISNRINGLKGGVKTEEGKAVSRMNAVTHGILSKDVLIPGENKKLLDDLRESYMTELQPVGEFETMLVEHIISDTWRLKRLIRSEKKYTPGPSLDISDQEEFIAGGDYRYPLWQNLVRYETALKKDLYKAFRELERLQNARLNAGSSQTFSNMLEKSGLKKYFCETNPV